RDGVVTVGKDCGVHGHGLADHPLDRKTTAIDFRPDALDHHPPAATAAVPLSPLRWHPAPISLFVRVRSSTPRSASAKNLQADKLAAFRPFILRAGGRNATLDPRRPVAELPACPRARAVGAAL